MSRKKQPRRRRSSPARGSSNDLTASATQPVEPEFLSRRTPRSVAAQETDWMPLPAIMATVFVGLTGYFIAEAALAPFDHPVHWLATFAAASLAYAAGLVWQRAKGLN